MTASGSSKHSPFKAKGPAREQIRRSLCPGYLKRNGETLYFFATRRK